MRLSSAYAILTKLLIEAARCRHVGMADEADSKSVVGDHVRVQVPLPALNGAKPNPVYFFKKVFAVVVNFTRK